jgi:hypothetical protein
MRATTSATLINIAHVQLKSTETIIINMEPCEWTWIAAQALGAKVSKDADPAMVPIWLLDGARRSSGTNADTPDWCAEVTTMQKFFFDMKDGVPMRDRVGVEFKTDAEAIIHSKELAQHWRDDSLRDDEDLEISVVNALGREVHREFVHRQEDHRDWRWCAVTTLLARALDGPFEQRRSDDVE